MALYDDNTDKKVLIVLTTIIDSLMARLDEKDKTIDSKDELISVKDSLLAAKDEIIKSLETNVAELTAAMANLKETLEEFQRRFFGISSEKTKNALTDGDEDAVLVGYFSGRFDRSCLQISSKEMGLFLGGGS